MHTQNFSGVLFINFILRKNSNSEYATDTNSIVFRKIFEMLIFDIYDL